MNTNKKEKLKTKIKSRNSRKSLTYHLKTKTKYNICLNNEFASHFDKKANFTSYKSKSSNKSDGCQNLSSGMNNVTDFHIYIKNTSGSVNESNISKLPNKPPNSVEIVKNSDSFLSAEKDDPQYKMPAQVKTILPLRTEKPNLVELGGELKKKLKEGLKMCRALHREKKDNSTAVPARLVTSSKTKEASITCEKITRHKDSNKFENYISHMRSDFEMMDKLLKTFKEDVEAIRNLLL